MQQDWSVKESLNHSQREYVELNISPHFFFNILNSIYHSIKLNPDQAENITIKFSELMQYYAYDCRNEKISLDKEIRNVRNFTALQRMRTPFELHENFLMPEDAESQLIMPQSFMAVVENVFKNGLSEPHPDSFLVMNFSVLENKADLNLTYTCPHNIGHHSSKFNSNFLKLQNRLQLLYPASHYLQIDRSNGTCSIHLQIHL